MTSSLTPIVAAGGGAHVVTERERLGGEGVETVLAGGDEAW